MNEEKKDYTVEATAVKEDGSLMIVAYFNDSPEILFSYDGVKFVDKDGELFVEYDLSFSTRKDNQKIEEESLIGDGERLLLKLLDGVIERAPQ